VDLLDIGVPIFVLPAWRRVLLGSSMLLGCAVPPAIPPSDLVTPVGEDVAEADANDGADATDELGRRLASLAALLDDPSVDPDGDARLAEVTAIAAIADARAVPVLRACVRQDADVQPVAVHRRCVEALGRVGDPAAVEDMVLAVFLVPDAVSTQDLASEVMLAVARIGEPAVAPVTAAFGQTEGVLAETAAELGFEPVLVDIMLAGMLGAIGSPRGTASVLRLLPPGGCPAAVEDVDELGHWGFAARQLGLIGDPSSVATLCSCALASHEPGLMFEVAQSLGWIGGSEATTCLTEVMAKATYDDDAIEDPGLRHELRWEAGRFAVLAAPASSAAELRDAFDHAAPAAVREQIERWRPGLALLERCTTEPECHAEALADPDAPAIVREKAAVELARLRPDDPEAALMLARAFAVADPEARLSIALALRRQMWGTDCPACAKALFDGLADDLAEPGSLDFSNLFAVIVGRQVAVGLEG
jgi:hypothetical protein